MLQGICVDPGPTAVLMKGKSYYLFPNGPNHFYVSNFPNQNSHKGCFQSCYFQLSDQGSWEPEPAIIKCNLNQEKIYKAKLIWRTPGYKLVELKEYYIKPRTTHADFYHDINLTKLHGCFPLHWFNSFVEVSSEIQQNLHFKKSLKEKESKKEMSNKVEHYEQLALF